MAEVLNASFVMHGARNAIAGGLAHIDQQVATIEQAVIENPPLAFDLAKTLVESVCRTVLTQRGIAHAEGDDLPRLFKKVTQHLPFLPPAVSVESDTRNSLRKTLGGLGTTVQGICELRNQCGFASHGSASPRPAMESVQALLAAEAADTIVGFLFRVHQQDRSPPPSSRKVYEASSEFNQYVDDAHELIRIFDVELRPSEILFQMEPESYRIYMAEFDTRAERREGNSSPVPEEGA